jgi:hypothetical protein
MADKTGFGRGQRTKYSFLTCWHAACVEGFCKKRTPVSRAGILGNEYLLKQHRVFHTDWVGAALRGLAISVRSSSRGAGVIEVRIPWQAWLR